MGEIYRAHIIQVNLKNILHRVNGKIRQRFLDWFLCTYASNGPLRTKFAEARETGRYLVLVGEFFNS